VERYEAGNGGNRQSRSDGAYDLLPEQGKNLAGAKAQRRQRDASIGLV
jgi:hypothetical protein